MQKAAMWTVLFTTFAAVILLASSLAQAEVIDVTVSVTGPADEVLPFVDGKYVIESGATAKLSVFGQLKVADAGNGIFGWDVDLRVGDPSVLSLNPASVDRSGWTGNASTSSDGTPTAWGLDGIYDTGEANSELGVSSAVRLFSIQFVGLSLGESSLTIEPDLTAGADFVTWKSGIGGDYSAASAMINVVPEPASMSLLATGALALLLIWRRRSK